MNRDIEKIAENYEANRLEISKYQDMQFRKDQAEYRKKYLGFIPSSKRWLVGKYWHIVTCIRIGRFRLGCRIAGVDLRG